jgi:hypothetical protein
MNEASARTRIESMVAWDQEPVLTPDQVTELVVLARRADVNSRWIEDDADWAATHAYALGDRVAGTPRNGHVYVVTAAGTSGASAPSFPTTSGGTVTDGTVTWQEAGGSWEPTYDLNSAAAEGWRWKAAIVAGQFDFSINAGPSQQSFARSAKHAHCLAMMQAYQAKVLSSPRIRSSVPVRTLPAIPVPYDDQVVA